jgi:hypothetical protein
MSACPELDGLERADNQPSRIRRTGGYPALLLYPRAVLCRAPALQSVAALEPGPWCGSALPGGCDRVCSKAAPRTTSRKTCRTCFPRCRNRVFCGFVLRAAPGSVPSPAIDLRTRACARVLAWNWPGFVHQTFPGGQAARLDGQRGSGRLGWVGARSAQQDGGSVREWGTVDAASMRCAHSYGDTEFYPTLWEKAAALLRGVAMTQGFIRAVSRQGALGTHELVTGVT